MSKTSENYVDYLMIKMHWYQMRMPNVRQTYDIYQMRRTLVSYNLCLSYTELVSYKLFKDIYCHPYNQIFRKRSNFGKKRKIYCDVKQYIYYIIFFIYHL